MLYAIGAGSQVKAVDKYSDYPKNAPRTTLDDLQPNVEAIVAYKPDLVVVPGDSSGLTGRLKAFGIPVLSLPPAATLADAYGEYAKLGEATGHVQAAQTEAAHVKAQIAQIVQRRAQVERGPDLLLRARPDLLLGDVVDVHRQGAGPPRTAQHRRSRPVGRVERRLSAAVGGVHRAVEPRLGVPGRHHLLRAECPHGGGAVRVVDDDGGRKRARWWCSTTTSRRDGGRASSTCSRRWRPR